MEALESLKPSEPVDSRPDTRAPADPVYAEHSPSNPAEEHTSNADANALAIMPLPVKIPSTPPVPIQHPQDDMHKPTTPAPPPAVPEASTPPPVATTVSKSPLIHPFAPQDAPSSTAAATQTPPPHMATVQTPSLAASAITVADGAENQIQVDPNRPLNVSDALGYLDAVKNKFQNNPDVYNNFLEIMKDFKSQRIDTPGVIERVSMLFTGHPALIQGFNTFLPPGYRIECSMDPKDVNMIKVTTPQGTMTQSTTGGLSHVMPVLPPGSIAIANLPQSMGVHDQNGTPLPTPVAFPVMTGMAVPTPFPPSNTPHSSTPIARNNTPLGTTATFASPRDPGPDFQPTEQAIEYVNRIKKRYADDPASYQHFLELLERFNKTPEDQSQVLQQIVQLFRNAPDLLDEFKLFLPSDGTTQANLLGIFGQLAGDAVAGNDGRPSDRSSSRKKDKGDGDKTSHTPQKRKRKPVDKELPVSKVPGPSKAKKPKHHHPPPEPSPPPQPPPQIHRRAPSPVFAPPFTHIAAQTGASYPLPLRSVAQEEKDATYFKRVKRFLDNRETYDEFLKLVNLYTQDVVDLRTLVMQSSSFLGDSELMTEFKDIVGWEEKERRDMEGATASTNAPKPIHKHGKADLSVRYGPSYRKLPPSVSDVSRWAYSMDDEAMVQEANVPCSGRDSMCNEVLNDEWVSHPSWSSEDSGFVAHKKNVYEEALHRSEEERHEYDFYIEAMSKTLGALEPIHAKILQLSEAERATFKLKPSWNGQLKSIHQRLLKKIYGREPGLEVVQALQDSPVLAVPVVLQRLKQKEEEWKRAQREWNKVWREVDARNFWKSLDHQGVTFKASDKKAITNKAFVNHIELAREEQLAKRASLVDPSFARTRPQYQLAYTIEDVSVLQDALKLVLSFLDRTQGQIGAHDRRKIENFMRQFIPLFFMFYQREFDSAFVLNTDGYDSDAIMSDGIGSILGDDDSGSVAGSTRSKNNGRRSAGGTDIRKKLLKATQQLDKGGSRRTRSAASTPASRAQSPQLSANTNSMDVDVVGGSYPMNGVHPSGSGTKKSLPPPHPAGKGYRIPNASTRKYSSQRGTFYANTTLFVLLRLLQLLYSRLHLCKNLGAQLAAEKSSGSVANPIAIELGIQTMPDGTSIPESVGTAAEYFYGHLLESCEKLFDNVIDQATFEDTLRFMFGMKAYNLFTIDKVIGALIKQVQTVLSDTKNKELVQLLHRERENPSFSTQDQVNYRRKAESVIGADEHLYRINYMRDSRTFTIQLLGKDDMGDDDSPAIVERWNSYMESYAKYNPADVIPAKVKLPFLRRNLRPQRVTPPNPSVLSNSGLELKVCMRTYRLFFVSNTEDFICWRNTVEDLQKWKANAAIQARRRTLWLQRFGRDGFAGGAKR